MIVLGHRPIFEQTFANQFLQVCRVIKRCVPVSLGVRCRKIGQPLHEVYPLLSSIAYQSLDPTISPERVVEVNRGVAVPDLTFMLKVPVDQCLQRLEQRNDSPTIYEKKEFLEGIDKNYESTSALYQKNYGPMMTIDGTLAVDEIHRVIAEKVSQHLSL